MIQCEMSIVDIKEPPALELPIYDAMLCAWVEASPNYAESIDGRLFETTQFVYDLLCERSPLFFR